MSKAQRIELLNFSTPPMRAFHVTWVSFFVCFFSWFGIAPLMKVVRQDLSLTSDQVGWCIIASVSATIFSRLLIGWLCDRIGPRLTYTWLLVLSSLPVMGIGLAQSFESFVVFRLLIGLIGASFVITQYHTSVMFDPKCVGTANATAAGWGNLGGGVVQFVMPLLFAGLVWLGLSDAFAWRAAMVVVGVVCLLMGFVYYRLTQDCPEGNYQQLRAEGKMPSASRKSGGFLDACRDVRVWALFIAYGACFGVELTIDNIAHTYFVDEFGLSLTAAGLAAAAFGVMNIFARSLGGIVSDRFGQRFGLRGRTAWLFVTLFVEGLTLMLFSQMRSLAFAIPALLFFGLFVKMSNGATYGVVPFVNRKALGSVAGIVGAGGNLGAVAAGFLFKELPWPTALLILGFAVTVCSFAPFLVQFAPSIERAAEQSLVPEGTATQGTA